MTTTPNPNVSWRRIDVAKLDLGGMKVAVIGDADGIAAHDICDKGVRSREAHTTGSGTFGYARSNSLLKKSVCDIAKLFIVISKPSDETESMLIPSLPVRGPRSSGVSRRYGRRLWQFTSFEPDSYPLLAGIGESHRSVCMHRARRGLRQLHPGTAV